MKDTNVGLWIHSAHLLSLKVSVMLQFLTVPESKCRK